MLRITEYIREALQGKEVAGQQMGVTLIWNLTNICNLHCRHCYASANQATETLLDMETILNVIPELKKAGVVFAILSGGEPLLRDNIFEISSALRENNIKTYLSTNGLLINEQNIDVIKKHFEYVGISIDGEPHIHDEFRGRDGSFAASMQAIKLCLNHGIRVGLRFTLTKTTYASLPFIFRLVEEEHIPKLYISHLVYSGRADAVTDIEKRDYLSAVRFILKKAFHYVENRLPVDIVTGNNEADAVLLIREFENRYPEMSGRLEGRLRQWGGNQAGVRLVNIDFRGNVKPDPFFSHPIGNIKDNGFGNIWNSNGILSALRERPRKIKGRCSECVYLDICNGNSRARSFAVHEDYLMEDPACYI